mmetsp:Transcript_17180/g.35585  ORF Transcript_17180/g.35585 Transcript_17180/m.35585 type:complete len:281 (-) Transcript_17180:911-1753(-)
MLGWIDFLNYTIPPYNTLRNTIVAHLQSNNQTFIRILYFRDNTLLATFGKLNMGSAHQPCWETFDPAAAIIVAFSRRFIRRTITLGFLPFIFQPASNIFQETQVILKFVWRILKKGINNRIFHLIREHEIQRTHRIPGSELKECISICQKIDSILIDTDCAVIFGEGPVAIWIFASHSLNNWITLQRRFWCYKFPSVHVEFLGLNQPKLLFQEARQVFELFCRYLQRIRRERMKNPRHHWTCEVCLQPQVGSNCTKVEPSEYMNPRHTVRTVGTTLPTFN